MNYRFLLLGSIVVFHSMLYCTVTEIAPGMTYQHLTYAEQSVHILTVDPHHYRIQIGLAHDHCTSAETTSAMAQRTGALAAINASFFDMGTTSKVRLFFYRLLERLGYPWHHAYPSYGCKIDDQWCSFSKVYTGALGWSSDNDNVRYGTLKNTAELSIDGQMYPVTDLNKPQASGPILYTSLYGNTTPRRYTKVCEIVIENDQVQSIHPKSYGATHIPEQGYVYTVQYSAMTPDMHTLCRGMPAHLVITSTQQNDTQQEQYWENAEYILGSTPLLIKKDGDIVPYVLERTSSFYTQKHARSAVGMRADGTWIFVTVDGNKKNTAGFTLPELAQYMQELGCIHALNVCGGRTATMVVQGKVVNTLAQAERALSTALLIMPKEATIIE